MPTNRRARRLLMLAGIGVLYALAAFGGVVVILAVGGGGDVVGQWLGFLGLGGLGGVLVGRLNTVHDQIADVKAHTGELVNGGITERVKREVGIELARLDADADRAEWVAQRERRDRDDDEDERSGR